MLKFVDLFCGIGSFHHSFKELGFECVMACDINASARETYKANYGIEPLGDITKIDPATIPAYDILCAGFPCQPFSQCGLQKGFDDDRGTMFFQIMKFATYHKPKFIILENVRGLYRHDNYRTFKRICCEMYAAGYELRFDVLTCSNYGLPQMRKRLIIIAVRKDLHLPMSELIDFTAYESTATLAQFLGKPFIKETAYTIRCGGRGSGVNDKHNWDGYIVGGIEYRLTLQDCLRLQGFESDFKLCGSTSAQWKQIGNTIPTVFTKMVGKNILKYYKNEPVD